MTLPDIRQRKNYDHRVKDDAGYLYAWKRFQGINAGFVRNLGVPIGIDGIAIEDRNR